MSRNAKVDAFIVAQSGHPVRLQVILVVATVTLWWMRVELIGRSDAGTQLSFGKQGASFL